MEFKQLECFVQIVDKKSFSKASKSLYISQPAVTSSIQKLEKTLEVQLLDRSGKEISMTQEGEVLYSYAHELLKLREQAMDELYQSHHLKNRTISISSSTIPAQYILPQIFKQFKEKHRGFFLKVSINRSKRVALDILSGKVNIGFVGSEYKNQNLEYVDMYDDKLMMIASKDISFHSKPDLTDIRGFDLIIREEGSGTRQIFEKVLFDVGKTLAYFNYVHELENTQAIKKMVELGFGIAFVSKLDIKNEVELGLLKAYELEELNLKRKFKMVYAKERHFSPGEEDFKKFVQQMIKNDNPY